MQQPLQITFRHLERDPAVEQLIASQAKKLDRLFDKITSCRVVIDAPGEHHRTGTPYRVRVDVAVPGADIVSEAPALDNPAHCELPVAVRDTFRAAASELARYAERSRTRRRRRVSEPARAK